jgi:hypothetical protein
MFVLRMQVVALVMLALVTCHASAPAQDVKGEPKKEDKKPADGPPLKDRLRKHEEEITKIRKVMLNEIEVEVKMLDAAIAKAQDDFKNGDRKALQKAGQLRGEKARLTSLRIQVEHGLRLNLFPPAPVLPAEQRVGISVSVPSSTLRDQIGLTKNEGLVIDRITPESHAAKIGLKQHDILVKIDGKAATSDVAGLRKMLAAIPAGTSVDVLIIRHGKQETIKGLAVPEK